MDAYTENAAWSAESPPLDAETIKAIFAERELDHGYRVSELMFEEGDSQ